MQFSSAPCVHISECTGVGGAVGGNFHFKYLQDVLNIIVVKTLL